MKNQPRSLACLLLLSAPLAALAQQMPTPEDPQALALLERSGMNTAKLAELLRFPVPASGSWPCTVDDAVLLTAIGLQDAVPRERWPASFRAQFEDGEAVARKMLRRQGLDAAAVPKDEYTIKQITPLEANCVDGQLDGKVRFVLSYSATSLSEQQHYNVMTSKVEPIKSRKNEETERLVELRFAKGEFLVRSLDVMRGTVMNRLLYENPEMQRKADEIAKPRPMPVRIATFLFGDREKPEGSVMFTWNEDIAFSASLFGVKETKSQSIGTTINLSGPPLARSYMYKNEALTMRSRGNPATGSSESIMYMDNYLKPLGKTPRDMPNMENTREVRLNGKDMLEQRTCTINYQLVKVDPCPVE